MSTRRYRAFTATAHREAGGNKLTPLLRDSKGRWDILLFGLAKWARSVRFGFCAPEGRLQKGAHTGSWASPEVLEARLRVDVVDTVDIVDSVNASIPAFELRCSFQDLGPIESSESHSSTPKCLTLSMPDQELRRRKEAFPTRFCQASPRSDARSGNFFASRWSSNWKNQALKTSWHGRAFTAADFRISGNAGSIAECQAFEQKEIVIFARE